MTEEDQQAIIKSAAQELKRKRQRDQEHYEAKQRAMAEVEELEASPIFGIF